MEFSSLYMADMAACVFLALAASCRATVYGASPTGSLVLGCLVGIVSPVARDVLLGLGSVTPLHDGAYAAAALAGALLGLPAARWRAPLLFRCAEALSLGLATTLGASHGIVMGLPPVGCILLGICTGTIGGVVRDVCLGDTPQALERQFYVTASAVGCMAVIALWHVQVGRFGQEVLGTALVVALRSWGYWREQRGRQFS